MTCRLLPAAGLLLFIVFVTVPPAQAASVSALFKRVNPAVVVIETAERALSSDSPGEMIPTRSIGSGVVVTSDGLIMTAAHVVHVADVVNVKLLDGRTFGATVLGSIEAADVALVKLDIVPKGLSAAQLGDSDKVDIGDAVFVVGAPYGVEHTLTVGHISGRRRPEDLTAQLVPIEFLQTDAAINQGNSGGPMFNMQGEVVGIVSSILTQSGGFEGIGFAVSINIARDLLLNQKPFYVGLEVYFLHDELAQALNVPQEAGLLVQRVAADSLGQRLGLRPSSIPVSFGERDIYIGGDIILEIQNIKIRNNVELMRRLRSVLQALKPGQSFTCRVLRRGEVVTLTTSK